MSGETIVKLGTQKTLEANGVSIANNTLALADDASYNIVADGAYYPDTDFVLTATFGTAPIEGMVIALYARPLDVDGTADTEVPETTRPTVFVGSFVVNDVTTAQTMTLRAFDVPTKADYYIHNNGTGQTISAGWVLKVTPRTVAPAA